MEMGFLAAPAWLWHLVFFAAIFVCGWLSSALAPVLRTAVESVCWWSLSVIGSAFVAYLFFVSRHIL